jgi:hypothetical protein
LVARADPVLKALVFLRFADPMISCARESPSGRRRARGDRAFSR